MPAQTENENPSMRDLTGRISSYTRWLANFNAQLGVAGNAIASTAVAASYPGTASTFNAAWVSALSLVNSTQRSRSAVAALRTLRVGNESNRGGQVETLRGMIKVIQAALTSLSSAQAPLATQIRVALGITPLTKFRAKTFIPTDGPELSIHTRNATILKIRYNVVGKGQDNKSKPKGCRGCLIKWDDFAGHSGQAFFTRTPGTIVFPDVVRGKKVGLIGYWVMGNSEYSPPSDTIYAYVP